MIVKLIFWDVFKVVVTVAYVGYLAIVSLAFDFADLIDDLGCSLGLPSQNQVEGVDDTACGSQSKALEAQLDLYLLAKVTLLSL